MGSEDVTPRIILPHH